ncbi:hypothetical protein FisN_9Lh307 [Fistulifera solaris]|uniref:PAS domain-containing protein n=1 Tax=Fistulifera solaris TaxID=1519565 RepID=A0A1Z5KM34_FISSO|nr:hypothetical protein FisN_9Lh307 [Fistulifera solaris]|eukprot:GAX26998.1 hypothetical protein FisN_9Lh307 [Fistulifera solaris]
MTIRSKTSKNSTMSFTADSGYVADRSSESSEGGDGNDGKGQEQTNEYRQSLTTAPRCKERPVRVRFNSVRTVRATHFDKRQERLNRMKDKRMTSLCDMISQLSNSAKLKSGNLREEDLPSCPNGKRWNIDKRIVSIEEALGFCGAPVLLIEAHSPYRVVHANAAYRAQFQVPDIELSEPHQHLSGFLEANFGEQIVRVRQVRGDEDQALSHFLLDLFVSNDMTPAQVVA